MTDIDNVFTWEGEVKYWDGDWYYENKDEWRVNNEEAGYLVRKAKELYEKGDDILIKKLSENYDFPNKFSFKDREFLKWLIGKNSAMIKVGRILSTCLNHFSEILSDPNKINECSYDTITSIVRQNVTIQIKDTKQNVEFNGWFYLNSIDKTQSSNISKNDFFIEMLEQYVLSLPGYFCKDIADFREKTTIDITSLIKLLQSHRVHQHVSFKLVNENLIKLNCKGKITQYNKGYICDCLPIPGKGKKEKKDYLEPKTVKTPEIVVTSSNVTDALLLLSQVWSDKFAESILISAPPGSGKEQFAKSIAYGTGRLDIDKDLSVIAFSMGKQEDLEKLLYGRKKEDGPVVSGAIANNNSSKGVIFLDEVHYPEKEPGIRASLLRPLESKEFIPSGGDENDKVIINNVLFVLATSIPLKGKKSGEIGLNDIPPIDFWTRMTHVLQIRHPFEGIWGEAINNIVENYFIFFWWERLEKYFKIDPETGENLQGTKDKDRDPSSFDYNLHQRKAQMGKLKKDIELKELSSKFREKLYLILKEERIQLHELSIRGFKNIVSRIFSISASEIVQGNDFNISKLEDCIEPIIYEILEIAKIDS